MALVSKSPPFFTSGNRSHNASTTDNLQNVTYLNIYLLIISFIPQLMSGGKHCSRLNRELES